MAVGNFKHTPVEYNEESLDQQNRKSGRVYVDERGNEYPSITRVLSILNKDAIIAWRKRVGEEEAVVSYTEYLELVENGTIENRAAPHLAIQYYDMSSDAKLSDLIKKVRADEQHHSEVNHRYADGK